MRTFKIYSLATPEPSFVTTVPIASTSAAGEVKQPGLYGVTPHQQLVKENR